MDVCACTCAKLLELCLTLCDPMDWAAMSSSRDFPDSRIEPLSFMSLALADGFFTTSATWEDPMDVYVYV